MKKRLLWIVVPLIIGLMFVSPGLMDGRQIDDETAGQDGVVLNFIPQPVTSLPQISFNPQWEIMNNHLVTDVAGIDEVQVNLYPGDEGHINLILQQGNDFYDLDMTVEGDPDRVTVLTQDMNHNGVSELVVIADQGASYKQVKLYSFDGDGWSCLLATDNLITLDLDKDGEVELISTSMGSLPPFISIYRWNGYQFEKSDILADTDSIYATLIDLDDKTVIEVGGNGVPRQYEYREGILTPLEGDGI